MVDTTTLSKTPMNYQIRSERFSSPIRATISFSSDDVYRCQLWEEWYMRNISRLKNTSEIGRLAAEGRNLIICSFRAKLFLPFSLSAGILKEGQLRGADAVAKGLADELVQCGDDRLKLMKCAVTVYSKETFLYKVFNAALRTNDLSKVTTLGPLCFLINAYVSGRTTLTAERTLYRSMNLTTKMIDEYKEAIGEEIAWPAFTSTTQSLAVAEMLDGNTVCIIKLWAGLFVHGKDVSDISHMPWEEEFLLSVGFMLLVEKIDFEPARNKHFIYLRSTCHA